MMYPANSPEGKLESLVKKTMMALEGKSFEIKKTLTIELRGHLYPSPHGEQDVDGLEITILDNDKSENSINDSLLTTLEEVISDHISNAVSSDETTEIPQIDEIGEELKAGLEVIETETIKLGETFDKQGIEWPSNPWVDPGFHNDLWDAVLDQAHERNNPTKAYVPPTLPENFATPSSVRQDVEITGFSRTAETDKVAEVAEEAGVAEKVAAKPPRAVAATPIKAPNQSR